MRGFSPARLLLALLATGASTVAVSAELTTEAVEDCCPAGKFCCGEVCEPKHLQPRILCIFSETGCCGTDPGPLLEPHPKPWPKPHPKPWPKPLPEPEHDCCPTGYFCCGGTCVEDSLAPNVRASRCSGESCCNSKPWPFPKPVPKPLPEPEGDCCSEGKFCCAGDCMDDSLKLFSKCRRDGCCNRDHEVDLEHEKKKCCAEKNRVCCDGSCFPPNTRFVRACDGSSCGCPDEQHTPKPWPWPRPQPGPWPQPDPKPWPKPQPKPWPKPDRFPLPLPDDCCSKGKACCGTKCVSRRRYSSLVCPRSLGGCCRKKTQGQKTKRRHRKKHFRKKSLNLKA